MTGFTIAAYIIADGLGVRSAGPTFQHRLSYIAWLCVVEGPWLLVLAIVLRPATVWAHLRRTWWRGAIGGVIANVGYGIAIYSLVLWPMAHIAALREPFGLRRVAAAFVIVVGLVMMNGPQLI
jgi:drug/metabolite transporter (DMT)-like permease